MRDIPAFETEYGTAGLVLNQIPCTGNAYIHILNTDRLKELLDECIAFCKMAGANRIYACGDEGLSLFPHYTDVLRMSCMLEDIEDTSDCLMPVTEESCEEWRLLYNKRMAGVDNAAVLTEIACRKIVKEGGVYFVHSKGNLLGIGIAVGEEIRAVATVSPGEGARVVRTLCRALSGPLVKVEVATTNIRAIRLYKKLGFLPNGIIRRWYRVL